ncbi:hypothetical protein MRX96_050854, partial [Rhipicephalus microplus]
MHWARATGFKNKKKHCVMAVPVLYPSPQCELESSASPRIVTTPPTTVHRSLFTTVEAVRSPLLLPGAEPSQPTLGRNPVMLFRPMETHSSVESPVEPVSPPGTRVGYSFDSYE